MRELLSDLANESFHVADVLLNNDSAASELYAMLSSDKSQNQELLEHNLQLETFHSAMSGELKGSHMIF